MRYLLLTMICIQIAGLASGQDRIDPDEMPDPFSRPSDYKYLDDGEPVWVDSRTGNAYDLGGRLAVRKPSEFWTYAFWGGGILGGLWLLNNLFNSKPKTALPSDRFRDNEDRVDKSPGAS